MNKPNKSKHVDTENNLSGYQRERLSGRGCLKGINCMMMGGNYIFGNEHIVGYAEEKHNVLHLKLT